MLKNLIRVVVSVALLVFVLRSVDLGLLWNRVLDMDAAWLALALGAYLWMMWLGVWRWDRLLRAQHIEVGWRELTRSLWISIFFNNFLPSNIGGDVMRVADTAGPAGSKTLATTVIIADRVLGLIALIIVASTGAFAASMAGVHVPGARWLWLVCIGGFVATIPVVAVPQFVGHLLTPVRALNNPWVTERAQRMEDAVVKFRAAPAALAGAFAGAIGVQVTIVGFYLLVARGLAVPLPVFLGAVLIPVSLAVQMVPVSINGLGVREAVFAFFFARFGLPTEAAVALSLLSAALMMLLSLVGGVMFVLRRK